MKFLAVLLLSLFLCGDSYADTDPLRESLEQIHDETRSRFTYVESLANTSREVFMYYGSDDRVRGDCDDFASAAYYQLWKEGFDPITYTYDSLYDHYRHVIVCAAGYCLDNNRKNIFPEENFTRKLGKSFVLVISGRLDEERMAFLFMRDIQPNFSQM